MGDFKIDLLKTGDHSSTSDFVDLLYSNHLVPLIVKPTRVTGSTATIIDYILTNNFTDDIGHFQGIVRPLHNISY